MRFLTAFFWDGIGRRDCFYMPSRGRRLRRQLSFGPEGLHGLLQWAERQFAFVSEQLHRCVWEMRTKVH